MTNLFFIIGPEVLMRDTYIRKLTEGMTVTKKDTLSFEDALALNTEDIFFNEPKALVIKKGELGADGEMLNVLSKIGELKNPCIITALNAKENTKLYKFLSCEATVLNASALAPDKYDKFLKVRIGKYGVKITENDFSYLKEKFSYTKSDIDLLEIDRYLWQLSFFDAADRACIDSLVHVTRREGAFEVIRAIGTDDFVRRASALEDDYIQLLSAFLYSLRLALQIKVCGKKVAESWKVDKIRHVLSKPDEAIASAMKELQKGIDLIKEGAPQRSAYIASVTLAKNCF